MLIFLRDFTCVGVRTRGGCFISPPYQILLVQLKEREEVAPSEGGQLQQPPSAEVLRHLVAISGEGQGEAESIYSFSEVCFEFVFVACAFS